MIELAALALIGVALVAVFVAFSFLLLVVKAILWIGLLPLRLLLALLFIPLLVLKFVFGGVLLLVAAPIIAIVSIVGVLVTILALAIPILPLLLAGFLIFVIYRLASGSPAAV